MNYHHETISDLVYFLSEHRILISMQVDALPLLESFDFKYLKYDEIISYIRDLEQKYPELLKIEIIGKTYEGRDLPLVIVSKTNKKDTEKPAYYMDANIHAGEVTGSVVNLYTITYLCENYDKQALIKHLLDNFVFYIIPRISIDGAEVYLTSPRMLRSSTRYWPYPEKLPGFHEEDINGDGEILIMRKKDPLGDWKISDKDPRIMVKRGLDEIDGDFYRLFPEGMLHDWEKYDPITIAPTPEGLDLNRNNPAKWAQEYVQSGAGPYPLSEPETRAIADFFRNHPNICGVQSFHTFSGVILRPLSFTDDNALENHDLEFYNALGKIGEQLTGYPCINIHKDFKYDRKKELLGGFLDWTFEHMGLFTFSTELWDMIKEAGIENRDYIKFLMYERSEDDELKLLQWNDKVLNGDGFVNWSSFEHPQLGHVEIGGWKFKYTFQNPPLINNYLQDVCHHNAQFAFVHALMNPIIKIVNNGVKEISQNTYEISISIVNHGVLPTYVSSQAMQRKVVKDNELKISCENCSLIGPSKIKFPHLQGRSNKLRNNIFANFSPEDQKWTYRFVVNGHGKISITAYTDRAGVEYLDINI